jgi:hypothetical protein
MILYFASGKYTNTLKTVLQQWAQELRRVIKPMTYGQLWQARELPKATYIFSDFERMTPEMRRMAAGYADQLRPYGRILNEPAKVKSRYELLRELHQQGVNDFRAYRIDEIPKRAAYPLFVRPENDHKGPRSELLYGPNEVTRACLELVSQGFEYSKLIAVEFMAEVDHRGLFHRHGTHNLGGEIVPQVLTYSKDWCVKGLGVRSKEIAQEEVRYNRENPHREQIKRVFKLANIDYGRMDYSVIGDRIQVYEINTNPVVIFRKNELNFFYRRQIGTPFIRDYSRIMQSLDSEATGSVELDQQAVIDSVMGQPSRLADAV